MLLSCPTEEGAFKETLACFAAKFLGASARLSLLELLVTPMTNFFHRNNLSFHINSPYVSCKINIDDSIQDNTKLKING